MICYDIENMEHKFDKYVGRRYGRLVALSFESKTNSLNSTFLNTLCDCGKKTIKKLSNLLQGDVRSCGCLFKDSLIKRNTSHGLSGTKIHMVYHSMLGRCYNKSNKAYDDYGGRGIKVYRPWKKDILKFKEYCDKNGWFEGCSIDRINNNKGYYPGNLRFTDHKGQARNTRRNVLIRYKGETKCISEWAEITGLAIGKLSTRYKRGLRGSELFEPDYLRKLKKQDVLDIRELYQKGKSIREISIKFSVTKENISSIIKRKTWRNV